MTEKRSRLEIYLDVLRVISNGCSKPTRIMYSSNLSWKPLKEILESLIKQELIRVEVEKKAKRYYITPRGLRVLGYFKKIREELIVR
ncbi:transcriptional regulator [Candidatus Bathyarchaeota archaeon]|nr:transcriptional regulator [Candidatus Bathyarchaeota archaeon]